MTRQQLKSVQKSLGKRAIRRARQQFAAELALLNEVLALTDYLADWDAALDENALYDARRDAEDILAAIEAK